MNSLAQSSQKKIFTVFIRQNGCLQEMSRKGGRMLNVEVSQRIVEMKLKKLNINKASAVDGIHQSLLGELSEQLSGHLSMLFRRTLNEGMVSND